MSNNKKNNKIWRLCLFKYETFNYLLKIIKQNLLYYIFLKIIIETFYVLLTYILDMLIWWNNLDFGCSLTIDQESKILYILKMDLMDLFIESYVTFNL